MSENDRLMRVIPSEKEFLRLSKRGNVIPVYGKLRADLETPVSAFLKLDDGHFSYLLESVEGSEKVARFSFLGSQPRMLVTAAGRHVEFTQLAAGKGRKLKRFETEQDPLREVERLMGRYRFVSVPGLPRLTGGLVGYLGYNVVQYFERIPRHQVQDLKLPDMMLMLTDEMVIFDHAQHVLLLVVNAMLEDGAPKSVYRRAVQRIERLARKLVAPMPQPVRRKRSRARLAVRSNMTKAAFAKMVKRAKEAIRAGDVIQVVLSQRLERPIHSDPFDVYRSLRSLNPSPYMFFLRFEDVAIAGSSPEMLVRREGEAVETRPIAGTRPRGISPKEDERLVRQLKASSKERAEHLMLVDLGRNDLGRISKIGTVQIPEFMIVERYSHVLHLVSSVIGRLRKGLSAYDVLRATFPAGTVTGAPKVRAMELIAELEREDRGPYAGAVGYLSFSGNLDTGITIRTIVMKGGRAYVQAGAGIVADSNPGREYQETMNKAKGMLRALELAEGESA